MRIYEPQDCPLNYHDDLKKALSSVVANKKDYEKLGGQLRLLINDDTKRCGWNLYRGHLNWLYATLKDLGFTAQDFLLVETNSQGSSYATYNIRKLFVDVAKDDSAIAITLDQDDILRPRAVSSIARHMPINGMTVSRFKIIDSNNLDITNDGGRQHNRLVWLKSLKCNTLFPFYKSENKCFLVEETPRHFKLTRFFQQKRLRYCESIRHFWAKRFWCTDFVYVSTLGWTKSYSRGLMCRFMRDLESFLEEDRNGTKTYFQQHRAYEDFLDFYFFLYADVNVGWIRRRSHVYLKHAESITSQPKLADFQNHRTASLLTLIDMTYKNINSLREDCQYHLLRFITVKSIQIETILKKYRHEYLDGKNQLKDFAARTHEGYFVNKLCRLALGEYRGPKDDVLFQYKETSRTNNTAADITTLFSYANSIREYKLHLKNDDLRYVIRQCIDAESSLKHVKYDVDSNDENFDKSYDSRPTPAQQRYRMTRDVVVLLGIICVALLCAYFNPCIAYIWTWVPGSITERIRLVDVLIPLLVAIFTFSANELSKLKIQAIEEDNQKKLYYSEFEDLIRHLEANFKVLAQLRNNLMPGSVPDSIHFENLKWPVTSCLFSDDVAKIIGRDRVDDFARLKVNLRNINNSAEWLAEAFKNKSIPLSEQQDCLDWEMTRYIGYLLNFYYLKENRFSFPSLWQLDEFMEGSTQKNKLSGLFIFEEDGDVRKSLATMYIERYLKDRREERNVIIR